MSFIHRTVFVMVVALTPAWAVGQADESRVKSMSVDELKNLYLACDRAALRGQLGGAGIAQCSVIYEELKRQAFDGAFERLLAWSRLHPSVQNTGE